MIIDRADAIEPRRDLAERRDWRATAEDSRPRRLRQAQGGARSEQQPSDPPEGWILSRASDRLATALPSRRNSSGAGNESLVNWRAARLNGGRNQPCASRIVELWRGRCGRRWTGRVLCDATGVAVVVYGAISFPPTITIDTRFTFSMLSSGLAPSSTRSALFPGAIVPSDSIRQDIRRGSSVTVISASNGLSPARTRRASSSGSREIVPLSGRSVPPRSQLPLASFGGRDRGPSGGAFRRS